MASISIALGEDCRSTIFGVRSKMRPSKKDGYQSCPFDLMVADVKGVIKCFNDNFNLFTERSFLIRRPFEDQKHYLISNHEYGFYFNHESFTPEAILNKNIWTEGSDHFIKNDFQNFTKRYKQRIQNLDLYCNSGFFKVNFIFVSKHCERNPWADPSTYNAGYPKEVMRDLCESIKNRYPKLVFNLVILPSEWHEDKSFLPEKTKTYPSDYFK